VANLDQVLIVFACAQPMPHLRMLDRFLLVADYNEVDALIVVNKVDLCGSSSAADTFGVYRDIGYRVEYVSARAGAGIQALRHQLAGRVSVVVGPSGVGKSTLLNAIQPGLRLDTGEVSQALHKGRHTTTEAQLHRLETVEQGTDERPGYLADTPGLRELGLFRIPESELAHCFREMRPFLGPCAFNDCAHLTEPRCAVRDAVAAGAVPPERYDSYRRLRAGEG
jgi:ribosome biogenesis GTPase